MKVIGFCGTAKNTGKTTTMKIVMDGAYEKGIRIALTSIGYDGELLDHITGLPKPRIYAQIGTLVAISDSCAKGSQADIEILKKTDIRTALGPVVIGRVRKAGLVLLAGPTKTVDIKKANAYLEEYGCDLVLVDGALSRIAPMVDMDGIVMATGASRTSDIDRLVDETAALANIYDVEIYPYSEEEIQKMEEKGEILKCGSLLDEDMAEAMINRITDSTKAICIDGIIGEYAFDYMFEDGLEALKGKTLVLKDPMKILVAGNSTEIKNWMDKFKRNHIEIMVQKQVPLKLITINPFYPMYRFETHDYEAAYVNKEELKTKMQSKVTATVVNVLDETEEQVFERIIGK